MSAMPDLRQSRETCRSCPVAYVSDGLLYCPLAKGGARLPQSYCAVPEARLAEVGREMLRRAGVE
jgi:hypothetical protein